MIALTKEEFDVLQKALRCYELDENLKDKARINANCFTSEAQSAHDNRRKLVSSISMKLKAMESDVN